MAMAFLKMLGLERRVDAKLLGHIDGVDRTFVAGWAAYSNGRAPHLTICVNGAPVAKIVPSNPRSDLRSLFRSKKNFGFHHIFHDPIENDAEVSLVDQSGQHIPTSPQRVDQFQPANLRALTTPVPPADLIFLVNGHRDPQQYAAQRSLTVDSIISMLSECGTDYRTFHSILDLGCGCGRVLSGWEGMLAKETELFGVDINPTLVEFCKNIPFARTSVCSAHPPLDFQSDRFDFVYAASVFTHMTREQAFEWAGEIRRVLRPGGTLMMSYSGSYYAPTLAGLSRDSYRELEETGFSLVVHVKPTDTFEGSNHYATFMTSAFARRLMTGFDLVRLFPGISHGPNCFASYQDIAIFRKRNERAES